MIKKDQNHTRMSGMDQIIWNMVNDQDLFCIWGISRLEEPLYDNLIEKTLKYLIETIPILNCKTETNWLKGRWQFVEKKDVKDLIVRIQSESANDAEEHLKKVFVNPIDVSKEAMIRVISIDGPTKHYFIIQIHHLVFDGEGLKRVCVRFAEIYQQLFKDENWKPDQILDPNRSWWQIAKNFGPRHLWLMMRASIINTYLILIKPLLLKRTRYNLRGDSDTAADSLTLTSPHFESIVIEKDIMLKLKKFTKRKKCTVNDILMTSLSLAVSHWNKGRGDKRKWLRFAYTTNLRRWWGEPKGTFANYSAILVFEELSKNLIDPVTALSSVKAKVDKVKKRIALDVFPFMVHLKMIPYFLVRIFSLWLKDKAMAFLRYTHAMTNIGIVFEEAGDFGHTKALEYSLLAPACPGGCSIYTVSTYKNVTTIHIGCNEDYLKKESGNSFLKLWKQKIQEVIGAE